MPTLTVYPGSVLAGGWDIGPAPTPVPSGTPIITAIADTSTANYASFEVYKAVTRVYEFDLSSLPLKSAILGVSLEFGMRGGGHNIRLSTGAVTANGLIVRGPTENYLSGYLYQDLVFRTPERVALADGSLWASYNRLMVMVEQSTASAVSNPSNNQMHWVRAHVRYEDAAPPVATITDPVGAVATATRVAWDYSGGRPQTLYHATIWPRAAAATAGFNPSAPGALFDTGAKQGQNVRSVVVDVPLEIGDYTAFVRVGSTTESGRALVSDWAESLFNATAPPPVPDQPAQVAAQWTDSGDGGVAVTVTEATTPTRAGETVIVERAVNGGRWVEVHRAGWTAGSPRRVYWSDYAAPLQTTVKYRARILGDLAWKLSAWVESPTVSTASDYWWIIDPVNPGLSFPMGPPPLGVDVTKYDVSELIESVSARQGPPSGASVTATSGSLGDEVTLEFRTLDRNARIALEAVLNTGRRFRLVDILGRSRWVIPAGPIGKGMLRLKPTAGEATKLRDAHTVTVKLDEVF